MTDRQTDISLSTKLTTIKSILNNQINELKKVNQRLLSNILDWLQKELKEYETYQTHIEELSERERLKIEHKYEELTKLISSSQERIADVLNAEQKEEPLKEYPISEEILQDKNYKSFLTNFFSKNNNTNQYHINEHTFDIANTPEKIQSLINIYTSRKKQLEDSNTQQLEDSKHPQTKTLMQDLLWEVDRYIIKYLQQRFITLQKYLVKDQQYGRLFQETFTILKTRWDKIPYELQNRLKTHRTTQTILFLFAQNKINKVFKKFSSSKDIQNIKTTFEKEIAKYKNNQDKIKVIQRTMTNMIPYISQLQPWWEERNNTNFTIDNKVNNVIQTIDKDLQWYEQYLKEQCKEQWNTNSHLYNLVEERKAKIFQSYNWFDQTFKTQKYKDAMKEWDIIVEKIQDWSAFDNVIKLRQIWIEDWKLKHGNFDTLHSDWEFWKKTEAWQSFSEFYS